ncbi:MAG: DUF2062 domain-containing protein [Candidatus Auribacterota bacterium]
MKITKLGRLIISLLRKNSSPHQIALGGSIGVFIGCTPLYGLHTVIALVIVLLIPRINKAAVLLGTAVSLPPFMPVVAWASLKTGSMVLPAKETNPLEEFITQLNLSTFNEMYIPLLIGGIIVGLLLAGLVYPSLYFPFKSLVLRRKSS